MTIPHGIVSAREKELAPLYTSVVLPFYSILRVLGKLNFHFLSPSNIKNWILFFEIWSWQVEYITKNRTLNVCPVQGASIKHVMSPNYDEKREWRGGCMMTVTGALKIAHRSLIKKIKMNTLAFDQWERFKSFLAFFVESQSRPATFDLFTWFWLDCIELLN